MELTGSASLKRLFSTWMLAAVPVYFTRTSDVSETMLLKIETSNWKNIERGRIIVR